MGRHVCAVAAHELAVLTFGVELQRDGAQSLQQVAGAARLLDLGLRGLDELGGAVGRDGDDVGEALAQLAAQALRCLDGLWGVSKKNSDKTRIQGQR
jgi:hypothetical protein